jgi:hypothetical protein
MRDTGGHIQEILHYKLICLKHLTDIVSYHPPEVKVFASGEGLSNQETWLQKLFASEPAKIQFWRLQSQGGKRPATITPGCGKKGWRG